MRIKSILTACSVLVLFLLISGCAKPPTLEIDAAKAAIQAAKVVEADVYAASEFGAAQRALADAEAKVTGKEYELAKTAALQAKEKADAAKSAAGTGKAKAKAGSEEALTQAKAEVAGVKELIANAPKKADLGTLESDLEQVEQGLPEADAAYNREDYMGAASKADLIKRNAAGIGESVQIALDTYAAELLKRQSQWYEDARKKQCP
jgi:hypothetical protein